MPVFSYSAASRSGALEQGTLDASSEQVVLRELRSRGLTPVRVVVGAQKPPKAPSKSIAQGAPAVSTAPGAKKLKRRDIVSFTSELATLLRAGMPVDRALAVQEEMTVNPVYKSLLSDLRDDVKSGKPLSSALERRDTLFGAFFINMVRAGEASGSLGPVLERLADALSLAEQRRGSVVSALMYPAILLVVAVLAVAVMLGFVVPQFEALFDDMGEGLPGMTRAVLAMGKFVESYAVFLMAFTGLGVWASRRWLQSADGRAWRDNKLLNMPLVGQLVRHFALAQFARTLGTLLGNGVQMLSAIKIASDTVENTRLRAAMSELPAAVKGGRALSAIMGTNEEFSPLMVQMVRVGEESGRLGDMLLEVARIYDAESDALIKRLLSLIEPALILIMGVVIAVLIVSILMGILAVNDLAI
ncbi:type II secretion system F family protein [Congregibacter sp.]|uniref:type II secretion system F family protein n=1 Tax=Congregibacter sp. TaxID=2744308 RepID=UPI003F6BCBDE